ncbi:MAG TPA: putative Ig domain-containing protein [Terriglobales bacterium]|nr:putative Ig domain-containing protein [Terriglobales bacterium]
MSRCSVAALVFCCIASGLAMGQGLRMQEFPTPGAVVGEPYVLPLHATGGMQPYNWQVTSGELPPGCRLHARASNISGVPTTAGEYNFTLSLADSSIPRQQIQRNFTVHVIAGLSIEWKQPPGVQGNTIAGSAIVSNQTPEEFTLTVVVVAVNQIGRATTLGYQHFKIAAGASTQIIPFSAAPGPGTYYVRADAAAHHAGRHRIYRASKQTGASLTVSQF